MYKILLYTKKHRYKMAAVVHMSTGEQGINPLDFILADGVKIN